MKVSPVATPGAAQPEAAGLGPIRAGIHGLLAAAGRPAAEACRGTWARVTIDKFRHWALQTLKKHRVSSHKFSMGIHRTTEIFVLRSYDLFRLNAK
jgi:hypothetical protein